MIEDIKYLQDELEQTKKQLTIVQEECTKLLLENRELREKVKGLTQYDKNV